MNTPVLLIVTIIWRSIISLHPEFGLFFPSRPSASVTSCPLVQDSCGLMSVGILLLKNVLAPANPGGNTVHSLQVEVVPNVQEPSRMQPSGHEFLQGSAIDLPAHLVLGLLQREREEAMGQLGLAGGSWTSSRPGRTGAGQSHRTAGGGRCGLRRGERGCVISCPRHWEPRPCLAWPYHGTVHSPSLSFPTCVLKDLDRTTSEGFDSSDNVVIPEPGGRVEL